jgi:uncharacterized protein YndB with AHSA1/START domain
MKIKKKINLAILAIFATFLGYVAIQSPNYTISREISINAPVEKIFPYLNNSKLAERWGPWLEVDPDAKMTYSGPDSGVGSRASWDGGKQLGTGSATIVESVPNQLVATKLEYIKPMYMTQDSVYLVKSSGNQTKVTWKVTGQNGFMSRLMCVFMNMDKMVGDMFEKGLSNLKILVETPQQGLSTDRGLQPTGSPKSPPK